jgi:group I intron endonuclease
MAENESRGGIYAIRNLVTQKKYVGSAICISKRISQHRRQLVSKKHHSIKLQRAWDKYGAAAFEFVVLAIVDDRAMLIPQEQAWIDFLDAVNSGYNMAATAGSLLGFKHTPETRQRMSEAHAGVPKSPAHVAAVAVALKGRVVPFEERAKMRAAKLGKARGPHSPEHRAKIAAANKGKKKSPEHCAANSRARTGKPWSLIRRAMFESKKKISPLAV